MVNEKLEKMLDLLELADKKKLEDLKVAKEMYMEVIRQCREIGEHSIACQIVAIEFEDKAQARELLMEGVEHELKKEYGSNRIPEYKRLQRAGQMLGDLGRQLGYEDWVKDGREGLEMDNRMYWRSRGAD